MTKVVVTGGSGRLGRWVIEEFLQHDYEVVNVDSRPATPSACRTVITDLTQLGQVYGVLDKADAVVHLAAIPVAYSHPNEVTFHNNVMSTYNVLEAASSLGIRKSVIASSESSYGLVFAVNRMEPQYVPMDEDHPQLPQDAYGLSKIVNEETAAMFHRKTGIQVVSFRLGNVISPEMYNTFQDASHDAIQHERILWSYIDARDAAVACRLAIEHDGLGAVSLNLAANDTRKDIPSRELLSARYPNVTDIRKDLETYETLLSNEKAKRVLGWEPVHHWRKYS